jgi:hypothetical protein
MAQATFLLKRRKKVTAWPISGVAGRAIRQAR